MTRPAVSLAPFDGHPGIDGDAVDPPARPAGRRRPPRGAGQRLLVAAGYATALLVLVLPLLAIFAQALSGGLLMLRDNLGQSSLHHAIGLTLLAAAISVPLNLVFGTLVAWCVTRYDFRGRGLLVALVDLPYATSPVVAGMCYMVVFGLESAFGRWLSAHDIQVIFAWPGIVLVTIFVTTPYVARILIPRMMQAGAEAEEAALLLGATGWQIFRRVTLPEVRWALLQGTVTSGARAIGEFGAVSVVSGTIMNQTLTVPLLIEQLNNDNKPAAAFTASALLAGIAVLTLLLRSVLERRGGTAR